MTGFRQSGLPEFKAADLIREHLLVQVRDEAFKLLEDDPGFKSGDNLLLKEELQAKSMNISKFKAPN